MGIIGSDGGSRRWRHAIPVVQWPISDGSGVDGGRVTRCQRMHIGIVGVVCRCVVQFVVVCQLRFILRLVDNTGHSVACKIASKDR